MREKTATTLCIFVKSPLPGAVKTRLTPFLAVGDAANLAAAFFSDTFALARSCEWARVVVACDGDPSLLELATGTEVWPQGTGDLGERMERVLIRALDASEAAIAIGTDSPGLPRRLLEAARLKFVGHDAVIGPSEDGGFYLFGLRRCPPGLLLGLPWSTATTRERLLESLRSSGMTMAEVEPWFDVDVPADLRRLAGLLREERAFAPSTARLLARLSNGWRIT